MTIYLGIAGTHSTGKTTFVQNVLQLAREHQLSAAVVSDTATRCRDAGFPILKDHTFESTLWIMTSVVKAELEAGLRAELVIVDRPVPDALGYLEAALAATGRHVTSEERAYLYGLAAHHVKRYGLLLKTTLDETIPLGPDRDPDLGFRRAADRHIEAALSEISTSWFDPNADTTQQRIRSLLTELGSSARG
ncbi:AAA family ATPase [Ramlibacter sp. G-1-2-2]|uniref:AAA family ATPase n=1 Tax=Ramlibacter agri TaxID=2728837 RepID=A0A848H1G6_9BURK|nr:AAA family ATPase [Ramlibacter agri]NML43472.1 AAA family ATPase [Ramlibacter agri]